MSANNTEAKASELELSGNWQSGWLKVHPQIAHSGWKPRPTWRARTALTANFKPAERGRAVKLQQKRGWKWKTVGWGRQNWAGQVEFTAPYKRNGRIAKYRAVATWHNGMRPYATKKRRTDAWGRHDFQDNFFGDSLNKQKWTLRTSDYSKAASRCWARVEADKGPVVANGTVRLSVRKDPDPPTNSEVPEGCSIRDDNDWRVNQSIGTQGQHSFRYGYAAARVKFHRKDGMHSSFWLNSDEPHEGEIDTVEWFGDRNDDSRELQTCVYLWPNGSLDKDCKQIKRPDQYGKKWYKKFHVFSVEWTKNKVIFRIDGKKVRKVKGVPQTDMHMILSTFSSDWEYERAKQWELPQVTKVDWVRYWDRNRSN